MLTWQLVVLFLTLGIVLATVLLVFVMDKRSGCAARARDQCLNERVAVLENELSAMMDGAFGVANHLHKVETNLKDTVQRQEQLQQRDMGNLPYNEAVRLVSKGAGVDELVEHCGLSRSEAELVAMLHKKSPPVMRSERDIENVASSSVQTEQPVTGDPLTEPPASEQANSGQPESEHKGATEQALENLMAEHLSHLQVDLLSSASDVLTSTQPVTESIARRERAQHSDQQQMDVSSAHNRAFDERH